MRAWRPVLRPWRAARITAVTELTQTGYVVSRLVMLITQVLLTWWLWRALYAGLRNGGTSAGLDVDQAVTYALLGVLYMQFRVANRSVNGDSMLQLMFRGTIAYWFLRPVSPRRYYLIRAAGDLAYGLGWGLLGYLVFLASGVVTGPASLAAGLAAAAAMALGLVVLYYLQLLVDLMSFWMVLNGNAVTAMRFVQNLLSGAFAPLWYFPAWFRRLDELLPFQATLNVPLSLYIGRVPVSAAAGDLAVQAAWCAGLAVAARLMWRRAAARVTVLGG